MVQILEAGVKTGKDHVASLQLEKGRAFSEKSVTRVHPVRRDHFPQTHQAVITQRR